MKNYIKYNMLLGTATLLLGNYCEADIRNNIDFTNKILKESNEPWATAAQNFINIFDTFNQQLITEAGKHDAKVAVSSFIDPLMWKKGRLILEWTEEYFLVPERVSKLNKKFSLFSINQEKYKKFFDKKVKPCLEKEICKNLKVMNLKDAGVFWEKNFVTPVEELLIAHSKEMNSDAKTLQILLDLYRCYICCETLAHKKPDWENFQAVYDEFFRCLIDTILSFKVSDKEANAKDEKMKILYALLVSHNASTLQGKKYFGHGRYEIDIDDLSESLQKELAFRNKDELDPHIISAISKAKELGDAITEVNKRRAEGRALRQGAGLL